MKGLPIVGVSIPDTITDETERATAFGEAVKKRASQLKGLARRMTKANPSLAFIVAPTTSSGKPNSGKPVVGIWRVEALAAV